MERKHTEAGEAMLQADRDMMAALIRRSRARQRGEAFGRRGLGGLLRTPGGQNPRAAAMPLPVDGRPRCAACETAAVSAPGAWCDRCDLAAENDGPRVGAGGAR